MEKELKLSPPWNTFVSELRILFAADPDVKIEYEDGSYEVKLFVEGEQKAEALARLIPAERVYGNVLLKVTVVPANKEEESDEALFRAAFDGNSAVDEIRNITTPYGDMSYVIFKKEVVQFFNDELSDPHGYKSTLYEDIARDVFGDTAVFFCTDTIKK